MEAFRLKVRDIEERIQQRKREREDVLGSAVGVLVDDSRRYSKRDSGASRLIGRIMSVIIILWQIIRQIAIFNSMESYSTQAREDMSFESAFEVVRGLQRKFVIRFTMLMARIKLLLIRRYFPSIDQLWQPLGQFKFDTRSCRKSCW